MTWFHHVGLLMPLANQGVLGAFTTVQKEHRRHVVHMATLRAQGEYNPLYFWPHVRPEANCGTYATPQ
jgi:hypothetical protein